jgi:serine protease AprX
MTIPSRRLLLSLGLAVSLSPTLSVLAASPDPASKIAPWIRERLERGQREEFLVLLDSPGRPAADAKLAPAELYARLTASARVGHRALLEDLAVKGVTARSFYIVDAVLVSGDSGLAHSLARRADVARIVGNPRLRGPVGIDAPSEAATSEPDLLVPTVNQWNIVMVRAPDVWAAYGTTGQGIVVASADTGVDWAHFAFQSRYRGYDPGTGEVNHSYAWHDAFGTYTIPYDDNSHGTHTLGTMVASDGYGVAPGATWIACKNMDHGFGTPASYIECMEWTLAPYPQGGDPMTQGRPDLAPHIVNNSWSCPPLEGCDPHTFDEPLARLRQAGILMVASAMNTGPSCSTVDNTPALDDDAFTVGAVDNQRAIADFSSRGPVTVDGSGRLKPNLVAPGRLVWSTLPDYSYGPKTGTSMAAPHVAGAAALLWSHRPALRGLTGLTRCILERSASPSATSPTGQVCGGIPPTTFPNHVLGAGLLDIFAAFALTSSDADPAPDVCDCAPSDPTAYGMPVEIGSLRWTGANALTWDAQGADTGSGTRYDVLRGDLAPLRTEGGIGGAVCFATGLASAGTTDPSNPLPGSGTYYLVRVRNACGNTGWGPNRVNTSCD